MSPSTKVSVLLAIAICASGCARKTADETPASGAPAQATWQPAVPTGTGSSRPTSRNTLPQTPCLPSMRAVTSTMAACTTSARRRSPRRSSGCACPQRAAGFDAAGSGPRRASNATISAAAIHNELFWLAEANGRPQPRLLPRLVSTEPYLNKPYAPLGQRLRAYIDYARAIPRAAAQIRAQPSHADARPWIAYGVNAFGGLRISNPEGCPAPIFRQGPGAAGGTQAANTAAAPMRGLAAWLEPSAPTATDDFAIGAATISSACSRRPRVRPAARTRRGNRARPISRATLRRSWRRADDSSRRERRCARRRCEHASRPTAPSRPPPAS